MTPFASHVLCEVVTSLFLFKLYIIFEFYAVQEDKCLYNWQKKAFPYINSVMEN